MKHFFRLFAYVFNVNGYFSRLIRLIDTAVNRFDGVSFVKIQDGFVIISYSVQALLGQVGKKKACDDFSSEKYNRLKAPFRYPSGIGGQLLFVFHQVRYLKKPVANPVHGYKRAAFAWSGFPSGVEAPYGLGFA